MTNIMKDFIEETTPVDVKKEGFVVDDMGKAMWAVDKIAEKEAEIAEIDAFVEARIKSILEWQEKQRQKIDFEINGFKTMLKPYVEQKLEGKKTKTMSLPNGSLSLGRVTTNFIKDDKKLIEFAKTSCPQFVKTEIKEKLDWAAMKKELTCADNGVVITADGEIVPDVTWMQVEGEFKVKTMA